MNLLEQITLDYLAIKDLDLEKVDQALRLMNEDMISEEAVLKILGFTEAEISSFREGTELKPAKKHRTMDLE
jgi:DNA integrity scanning protein DisA with diadenylate cyclase activity